MREAIARVIGLSFFASEHSAATTTATAAGHVVMDGIMRASLDASEPPRVEAAPTGWCRWGDLGCCFPVEAGEHGYARPRDGHLLRGARAGIAP